MRVPFNDPAREVRALGGAVEAAVASVVSSGWYVMGPQHDAFESEFAAYCGANHCLGVANGTDALEIALRAVGCGPGSEVVTVANAGMYTTAACVAIGATPVFVDVEPDTLQLAADGLEAALSPTTRAIVVTHLYGKMANVAPVLELAHSRRIPLIEDCAQAHGATRNGKRAGSLGDIAAFSFYPTKNLGALGDGGALITNDDDLAGCVRRLRQYGWDSKYHAVEPGGRNSRLDEMQAAVLRVKLPRLDEWNERRRAVASRYREALRATELTLLHEPAPDFVAHLCVGLHPDRDRFCERLAADGVDTAVHFPIPDHRQPALSAALWRAGALDVTESAAGELVSLPCYPGLTDDEVDWVCDTLARQR
jgi:aminotransferase EvaB